VPDHRLKGHRVVAIQQIRAAIAEIENGDPSHKAPGYLHDAADELTTSLSIARENAAPTGPPSATADATLPSPPPEPAPAPAAADAAPPLPLPPTPPTPAASATIPPEVTTEMEQAFLAKYKAAMAKPDIDAYMALIAQDSHLTADDKERIKGFMELDLAMESASHPQTYEFVPLPADSGKPDPPLEIDGKRYAGYLTPVVALKTTYAKMGHPAPGELVPSGPHTVPLGIQDHQLMIVGFKAAGDAPPAKKSDNFGITPNTRKLNDDRFGDGDFLSLDEFLASLKQPKVEVIASGETPLVYFAICRINSNLCVYADGNRHDQADSNYTFHVHASDLHNQPLTGNPTWIKLVEDKPDDSSPPAKEARAVFQTPSVQGTVFTMPDHYSGPVTIEADYWDDGGKELQPVLKTVLWQ
jgi:hypothetical protein